VKQGYGRWSLVGSWSVAFVECTSLQLRALFQTTPFNSPSYIPNITIDAMEYRYITLHLQLYLIFIQRALGPVVKRSHSVIGFSLSNSIKALGTPEVARCLTVSIRSVRPVSGSAGL
jgi:hypothetical protein